MNKLIKVIKRAEREESQERLMEATRKPMGPGHFVEREAAETVTRWVDEFRRRSQTGMIEARRFLGGV